MIAIIDYKAGNLTSVKRALDYLNIESIVTSDVNEINKADRVIFPGVGHAKTSMKVLVETGLDIAIKNVFNSGKPLLGICLGTQIILSHSEEGDTNCLDIINGNCLKFSFSDSKLKIPHMGWNSISITKSHPMLNGINDGDEFYFVHSYYPVPTNNTNVFAKTEYEISFASVLGQNNLFATQFHPEKSGEVGLKILSNFASWDGTC